MDPSGFERTRSNARVRRKKSPDTSRSSSTEGTNLPPVITHRNNVVEAPAGDEVEARIAPPAIRVLLVEDRPGDARLLKETLSSGSGSQFEITWVERLEDALQRLSQESFDAVLLDLSLPDSDGLETFLTLHGQHSRVPVVVLTGLSDELVAITAVQEGAQDYLVKGPMIGDGIRRSIRYAIERGRLLTQIDAVRAREQQAFHDINRLKSDMIAFVAHEFQQTLNAFNDHADSLEAANPKRTAEIAVEIREEVDTEMKRLTALIESFLEISESEEPHPIELTREVIDVRAMVEEGLKLAEAAAARCRFVLEFGDGVTTVHADRERTMQVLINLLANADHYSSLGSIVHVRVSRENDHLRFEVKNPRTLPRERQGAPSRVKAPDKSRESLDAHSSKSLIEAQGGKFGTRSQRGEGTVFYFTLPV